jgi:hypothetical protein
MGGGDDAPPDRDHAMNAIATNATVTCPKCFGAGKLRHFGHVEGGTCFL